MGTLSRGCVPPLQLSPPTQEGGRVAIVCDDDARRIVADLTVTVILRQTVAQIIGTVMIGGSVLPGSGGADHVVAGHLVGSFGMQPL
jgi:hypothetical protein